MTPTYDSAATLRSLVTFALAEDLSDAGDVTTKALIDDNTQSRFSFVSRDHGVLSGTDAARETLLHVDPDLSLEFVLSDGSELQPGSVIAHASGRLASLLIAERTSLNFLQHLSGVATLTAQVCCGSEKSGVTYHCSRHSKDASRLSRT
jgi:nicotinate-nucleotide pyrophosphorylase (carboxylating)